MCFAAQGVGDSGENDGMLAGTGAMRKDLYPMAYSVGADAAHDLVGWCNSIMSFQFLILPTV